MAPALDSGGTFLPKSYTRVALARAGRTSRTSNENNNKHHTHTQLVYKNKEVEMTTGPGAVPRLGDPVAHQSSTASCLVQHRPIR